MRAWLAALFLTLVFAGCTEKGNAPGEDVETFTPTWTNPIVVDHEHDDVALHAIANNMSLVGHTYMTPNGPPGGLGEIDVAGDYAFVATFDHGFAIIDLSNASAPEMVSLFEIPTPMLPLGRYTADLKVDGTGDWVFLAMELSEYPGVLIVDTRDKTEPKVAGFWPEPGLLLGCHMVEYAIINELEYLFCAPLDNAIYIGLLLPEAGGVREVVQVARWVPNSPAGVVDQVETISSDPAAVVSGHQDMTYQLDPLDGTPMIYVSFWNLGLRIVDVSIPAAPVEVGFWDGGDAANYSGNLHTSMAWKSEDGRRLLASAPETGTTPALFILDATDMSAPRILAEFQAKDEYGNASPFSYHNFQYVAGKLYLAMYHGGIWVLDVTTPEVPTAVGTYLTHQPRPDGAPYSASPWDVVVWNGYVLTAESNTGIYVLHLDRDPAGNEDYASFA
jgi:hypothetical protein